MATATAHAEAFATEATLAVTALAVVAEVSNAHYAAFMTVMATIVETIGFNQFLMINGQSYRRTVMAMTEVMTAGHNTAREHSTLHPTRTTH